MVYGPNAAKGLAAIGAVSDVIDSLRSNRGQISWSAAINLAEMARIDPSLFPEQTKARIRKALTELVREKEGPKLGYMKGLEVFGDRSTIPVLQQIREQDSFALRSGRHPNRIFAERVLLKLQARLQEESSKSREETPSESK